MDNVRLVLILVSFVLGLISLIRSRAAGLVEWAVVVLALAFSVEFLRSLFD